MRKLTLFILFFIITSSIAFAQTGASHIYGTILNRHGLPIKDVIVTLANEHIGEISEKSSKKGKFRFLNLVPGTYNLKLEKPGLKTFDKKNLSLAIREKVMLTITVENKNSKKKGHIIISRESKGLNISGERITLPSVNSNFTIKALL